jgi:bifunctional non-homologous end joining protein LigD
MSQTVDSSGRFVVQKHRARTLHYDFRLERDGVFKSWAVPKGVPETVGPRRLAVQVPDHPLEYGSFEGSIPEGEYGAGTVEIWDAGTYDLLQWSDDSIEFTLHGHRFEGTYSLIRFQKKGPRDWLLFRRRDGTRDVVGISEFKPPVSVDSQKSPRQNSLGLERIVRFGV